MPPDEVILAARVEDLAEKEAVLAEHVDAVFTTPHFNGYPAVLVRLDRVDEPLLRRSSPRPGWRWRRRSWREELRRDRGRLSSAGSLHQMRDRT